MNNINIKGNTDGGIVINNKNKIVIINKPNVSQKNYRNPSTFRPSLKDRENEHVTGYGFVANKYNDKYHTVINLVDEEGRYMADHTQLDLKETVYDYHIDLEDVRFIKFMGKVKKYQRKDNSVDYEIILTHKPILHDGFWFNPNMSNIYDKYNIEVDVRKINDYIENKISSRDIQNIILNISKEINELTKFDFGENFIFNYVTNTFFLNRATYDLYEKNIRGISCSNDALMDLAYILASLLYYLNTTRSSNIDTILTKATYWCNVMQNVRSYDKNYDCNFKKYCKRNLCMDTERQLKDAWFNLLNRKRNFGADVTGDFTIEDILDSAYPVLNDYIERID